MKDLLLLVLFFAFWGMLFVAATGDYRKRREQTIREKAVKAAKKKMGAKGSSTTGGFVDIYKCAGCGSVYAHRQSLDLNMLCPICHEVERGREIRMHKPPFSLEEIEASKELISKLSNH